ncbi:hypothetical protein GH733_017150 [Mirounga leonina]|nr:hypothetical protein GH733_017150 [Mirounga leonina]
MHPSKPKLTSHPDGTEELKVLVRESPESTGPDTAEVKNCLLAHDFLEEGLSQEIVETFSKDGLWNSSWGKACVGESWLDSILGDPESFQRSDFVTNKESPIECRSHELKRDLASEDPYPETL